MLLKLKTNFVLQNIIDIDNITNNILFLYKDQLHIKRDNILYNLENIDLIRNFALSFNTGEIILIDQEELSELIKSFKNIYDYFIKKNFNLTRDGKIINFLERNTFIN